MNDDSKGGAMTVQPTFTGGRNLAMKVPPHEFDATVRFYRDVLGLPEITTHPPSIGFKFGSCNLWIDRVAGISQAEVWLEVVTSDIAAASTHLADAGIVRRDEIEPLPAGFEAFWVSSPASIIHLVCKEAASWE
jgi:catechol 2,3-dioxygenase-like lactoylglutathione lyase family enzyme